MEGCQSSHLETEQVQKPSYVERGRMEKVIQF